MMSLKAFNSSAPAWDSDCSVSKLIKVVTDDCMENVMSEKSQKLQSILKLAIAFTLPKMETSLNCILY